MLHLSGHGGAGQFLLEHADGAPDPVSTAELVKFLRPLRSRVKLAVVSACQSAAATTAETLRWLGLDDPAAELEAQAAQEAGLASPVGVARALVAELGCAVRGRWPTRGSAPLVGSAPRIDELQVRSSVAPGLVADKCRCRPGDLTWRRVMIVRSRELIPATCHFPASALSLAVMV
ncbi:MAG: hypothetical protein ACRDST_12185 [Pseudonocardiaceae bacterium]